MASSTLVLQLTFGRGFLTLAYFLIPGYIAYKAYLHARIREDDFNQFDRLLYTVLFGFISLYIVSVISRLDLLLAVTEQSIAFSVEKFLNNGKNLSNIGDTTILQFVNTIALQAVIGTGIAYIVGKKLVPEEREEFDAKQPYETAMESIDKGDNMLIMTMNGEKFKGDLHQSGSRKDNSDFLLRKPQQWDSENSEFARVNSDSQEDLMYFNYNDISVIHFAGSKLPDRSQDDDSSVKDKGSGGALAEVTDQLASSEIVQFELKETQPDEDEETGDSTKKDD